MMLCVGRTLLSFYVCLCAPLGMMAVKWTNICAKFVSFPLPDFLPCYQKKLLNRNTKKLMKNTCLPCNTKVNLPEVFWYLRTITDTLVCRCNDCWSGVNKELSAAIRNFTAPAFRVCLPSRLRSCCLTILSPRIWRGHSCPQPLLD